MDRWSTALREFSDDLLDTEFSPLPEFAEWDYLETPEEVEAGVPAVPLETDWPTIFHEDDMPIWDEEIVAPLPYAGILIDDAFDDEFPLEDHAMRRPFEFERPPTYTGPPQPPMVDDHFMTLAMRPISPLVGAPPRPDNFWHSLNFMHDQLASFDVNDFLSDDIHRQVDSSLQAYDRFLDSLNDQLAYLFRDNIFLMHDINAEYSRFLDTLRWDAFSAHEAEHDILQATIEEFAVARELTSGNTQDRLATFAAMMPESRLPTGINQNLVEFAVSPFDITRIMLREDPTHAHILADPSVETFEHYQQIAIVIVVAVFIATLLISLISYLVTRRRQKANSMNMPSE